ncbi:S16 family serine protease [Streptomyces sp. NPDC001407]|uniref:YlbL family protein n=1 Tax=unclassified Streptomyces TaxID=2593676 RepID=UPI00340A939F
MLAPTSTRARLAICAAPFVALLAVAAFVPLPFSIAQPGSTVNVLGTDEGKPVITLSGADSRRTTGQLRMTTIQATGPRVEVSLSDVISGWFRTDRAVMPHDAVYPVGDSDKEVEAHNTAEMKKSQDSASAAALRYLHKSPDQVRVGLSLADVGGPSAGLLFTLGIIDKLDGDGRGGDLTGGRTIAGTGTIEPDGTVGAVGGVPLKTQAAKRDGATVFLVPRGECSDAGANLPAGLRLVPVDKLGDAVASLRDLASGREDKVPSC